MIPEVVASSSDRTTISMRHATAIIAAYNDYREWAESRGSSLPLHAFASNHLNITIYSDGEDLLVHIAPPASITRGGGVDYRLDGKTFAIKERLFGR